jgi:acetyl-CoA acetyltransferase
MVRVDRAALQESFSNGGQNTRSNGMRVVAREFLYRYGVTRNAVDAFAEWVV